tara:strand:+ start:836 stop:1168 length:333 start_codon:yes stop_codon:yes gene_type:complete
MAVQVSYTDEFGVTHAEAYARIDTLVFEPTGVLVKISVYRDADARSKSNETNMKVPVLLSSTMVKGSSYTTYFADSVLNTSGKTPFNQAYAWLKTVEEFGIDWTTGTTDV